MIHFWNTSSHHKPCIHGKEATLDLSTFDMSCNGELEAV